MGRADKDMPSARRRSAAFAAALLAVSAVGGCSKKMWVMQHPPFDTSQFKTVAVAPFRSDALGGPAGTIFADKLAAALKANATYRIVRPADLPAPTGATRPAGEAPDESVRRLLAKLHARGGVQAVIIGSMEAFRAASYNRYYLVPRGYPRYYYDYHPHYGAYRYPYYRRGWYSYDYYYDYEYYVVNKATVGVWAAIVRVSDGQTIHATPSLIATTLQDSGYPPEQRALQLLDRAADNVVAELLEAFAIVRKQIKVDPGKALRTAGGLTGGGWRYTDDFGARDKTIFVVVRLPRQADRNEFTVMITPKDSDDVLAESRFVWDRAKRLEALEFSLRDVAEAGGGPGRYAVKFYSQGELVMKRDFRIRAARPKAPAK